MSKAKQDVSVQIKTLFHTLEDLEKVLDAPILTQSLRNQFLKHELGIFRLVVVGEIKKGKSSLINAIVGMNEILPTSSDVATSIVYKLMYGPSPKARVFFSKKENTTERSREIELEDIRSYGTEDGNPNNIKGVDFIGIEYPSDLLKEGLVIIDTPGLGGLFKKHAAITWNHIPSADAVLFALDSVESVITRDEAQFLEKIKQMTTHLFFVQTKSDLVEREQVDGWRDRNLNVIAPILGKPESTIPYFPLSSRLKTQGDSRKSVRHLERSGFLEFNKYLREDLLDRKELQLRRKILNEIGPRVQEELVQVNSLISLVETTSGEERENARARLAEAQQQLSEWEKGGARKAMSDFNHELRVIQLATAQKLEGLLAASGTSAIVSGIIDELKTRQVDTNQIQEEQEQITSQFTDKCLEEIFEIHSGMNREIRTLVEGTSEKLCQNIDVTLADGIEIEQNTRATITFDRPQGTWGDMRTGYYGAGLGTAVAGALSSVLVMCFPPAAVAGPLITAVGGMMGAYFTSKEAGERNSERAIAQLQSHLINSLRELIQVASRKSRMMFLDIEKGATESFNAALQRRNQQLREAIQTADSSQRQSVSEQAEKLKELKNRFRVVERCREACDFLSQA
jgi:hypothetical protein